MKSKLSPFDAELFVMINDVAKMPPVVNEYPTDFQITVETNKLNSKEIDALKQAVSGRLGGRLLKTYITVNGIIFLVSYDSTEYPEEIKTDLKAPDTTAGQKYFRPLLEVDAIQVRQDNIEDLFRFTGGGSMKSPKTLFGKPIYSFVDCNGIILDAPESFYIVREPNGRITVQSERKFNNEFELMEVNDPLNKNSDCYYKGVPCDNDKFITACMKCDTAFGKEIQRLVENMKKQKKCCGECSEMKYEDNKGYGYCDIIEDKVHCSAASCKNYNPKK